jgi:hypothetical protein
MLLKRNIPSPAVPGQSRSAKQVANPSGRLSRRGLMLQSICGGGF